MKEDEYTNTLTRIRSVQYFICEISEKRFTQISNALYGDDGRRKPTETSEGC